MSGFVPFVAPLTFVTFMTFVLLLKLNPTDAACDRKFSMYDPAHTACLQVETPTEPTPTSDEKVQIVKRHNYYRRNVEKFNSQPAATNMQKMYWDEELAMVAQKWASNCEWKHDTNSQRMIPGSYSVGQNLAKGHNSWDEVLDHWQSEVDHLNFGLGTVPVDQNFAVGHYTQMVWAQSARIGCGFSDCGEFKYYVCNYATAGNYVKRKYSPYKSGVKASDCGADNIDDGLCDCGGKVCKNGGKLNLKTCQCECLKKSWIESGDCSLNCTNVAESWICESKGGKWGQNECRQFSNVPYQYCPLTCNLCYKAEEDSTTEPTAITTTIESTATKPGVSGTESKTPSATEKTTTPTTAPTSTPATTLATTTKTAPGLSQCLDVEPAMCGQPSQTGYYPATLCAYSLSKTCPAMCGKCSAYACEDYAGNRYSLGGKWHTIFGTFTCTAGGTMHKRGCFIKKANTVVDIGESHTYIEGNISWTCTCRSGYSLGCQGEWNS